MSNLVLIIATVAVLIALPVCYWYGKRDLTRRKAEEFADAVEVYIAVRNRG